MIEKYRNHRRQASQRNPETTVKGATVNREIQCLHCMFQFAITRRYITESPAAGVKHFDERRERPVKRMLTVEEQRILEAAPPHLRVAIILLVQTSGRTYSEGCHYDGNRWVSKTSSFTFAAMLRPKTPHNPFH
jgi:site-specific recombinase XerD